MTYVLPGWGSTGVGLVGPVVVSVDGGRVPRPSYETQVGPPV